MCSGSLQVLYYIEEKILNGKNKPKPFKCYCNAMR